MARKKAQPDLRMVKNGSLLWPDTFESRYRGTFPYVVDMNAPLERDLFCAGQEHKLRPLTKDERRKFRKATPIEGGDDANGRSCLAALSMIRQAEKDGFEPPAPKPVGDALDARAADAAAEVADLDIPEPDEVEVLAEEDEA